MAPPRKTIDELPEQGAYEAGNFLIVQDSGVTKKMAASLIVDQVGTPLQSHLDDALDAHDASAISATPSGTGVDGPNVQAQLGQIVGLMAPFNEVQVGTDEPVDAAIELWYDSDAPSDSASTPFIPPYFDVSSFGAFGDGVVDDTAALQAAINAAEAAGGGQVLLPSGTYKVTTEILLPSNVGLYSTHGGGQVGAPTKIDYAGAAGPRLIGPKNRAADTKNVAISGVELDGNGLVDIVLDVYRISYSTFINFAVYGATASIGVGVQLDANVSNQCYFNRFEGVKVDGPPVGVRFQNGANANQWIGGRVANGAAGFEFLSLSAGNVVAYVDCEDATTRHIHVDAPSNMFDGVHLESCPIGFNLTANAAKTTIIAPSIAGSVTTWLSDLSTVGYNLQESAADSYLLRFGTTKFASPVSSGSTALNIDPHPLTGTSTVTVRLFRFINTTGARQFVIYQGNNTSVAALTVDCATLRTTIGGPLQIDGQLDHNGTTVGFYGAAPVAKPTVTGAKGGNAALASLLTALAALGLVTDSSTA